jgi:uncharacterized membrane protein YhaH (DUF805 family)
VGALVAWLLALVTFLERAFPDGLQYAVPTLMVAPFFFGPIALIAVLAARRLHDLGVTALWIWIALVGVRILTFAVALLGFRHIAEPVGLVVICGLLICLGAAPGNPGPNEFGPQTSWRKVS